MQKNLAFSLLEMLITLVIICLITSLSVSSYTSTLQQANQKVFRNQLLSAIRYARTEAITLNQTTTLCSSLNQTSCNGSWESGLIVLVDHHLAFSFHPKDSESQLYWRSFPQYLDHLVFLPAGITNFQNGTFWYCEQNTANPAWAIMINQAGRARLVSPDSSGEIFDDSGQKLDC